MVAQQKQSGVVVETAIDNTTPAQLKTVAGVVDKLVNVREKEKIRAKNKYAQKKMEQYGRPVKQQPQRQVIMYEDNENELETGSDSEATARVRGI